MENQKSKKSARRILFIPLIISIASLSMVAYTYLTPPLFEEVPSWFGSGLARLMGGDFGMYLWRFLLSFLFFGVLPFVSALLMGFKPRELGLKFDFRNPRGAGFVFTGTFVLIVAVAILSGFIGALNKGIFNYYPYSRTLAYSIASLWRSGHVLRGLLLVLLHGGLYFLLYYLPWEFFFRGFLVFPLFEVVPGLSESLTKVKGLNPLLFIAFAIASFQIIPSTLLHFGHPLMENIAAIVYGLYAAFVTVYTRSIVPSLFTHFTVGFFTDLFIILRLTFG